jgi:hypothetical protein
MSILSRQSVASHSPTNLSESDGPAVLHPGVYSTDLVKQKALDYLSEASKSSQPFFLTVAPIGPHSCKSIRDEFPSGLCSLMTHHRGKKRRQILVRHPSDGHSRLCASSCDALPHRTALTHRVVQSRPSKWRIVGEGSAESRKCFLLSE